MVLVLITTKSESEKLEIATKVYSILHEKIPYLEICFVKVDDSPVIFRNGKMTVVSRPVIFIHGLELEFQSSEIRLENQIEEVTGFLTTIIS